MSVKKKSYLTVGNLKKIIEDNKLSDDIHIEVYDYRDRNFTIEVKVRIYNFEDGEKTLRIYKEY